MAALAVASSVSWLLAFVGNIGLIVVIVTAVRRHRPDAYAPLLAWAIGGLALTLFRSVVSAVLRVVVDRSAGVETMIGYQAVEMVLGSLAGIALVALLAYALVRLSEPPRAPHVPAQPPYR